MGGNFKFQVQDSFLEYFFFEIWRSKKRMALSEKKHLYSLYLALRQKYVDHAETIFLQE